jgi:Flp pilus assembly protein TadB
MEAGLLISDLRNRRQTGDGSWREMSMLALIGAVTVLVLLAVIMLNLLSPLVALIAVPLASPPSRR